MFTNGHVVDGDRVFVYYGAADTCVCGAELSIERILGRAYGGLNALAVKRGVVTH